MRLMIFIFFMSFLSFFWSGRSEDNINFKDDYVGIYTSVSGSPIRFNPRKDLIEQLTEGMRVYIDDEINTSGGDLVTCLFEDKSIIFLSEQTNFIIKDYRTPGSVYYQINHGKIRMNLSSVRQKFGILLGDGYKIFTNGIHLVADIYQNSEKNNIFEIIPLSTFVELIDKNNNKINVNAGEFVLINDDKVDIKKYKIKKDEFKKILLGLNGYRFLFDVKYQLIDQDAIYGILSELNSIVGPSEKSDYTLATNFEDEQEIFSTNQNYNLVNKKLIYQNFEIGLPDIPTYQGHVQEYASIEIRKKELLNDISFTKKNYEELEGKNVKLARKGSQAEADLMKQDYNRLLEEYSGLLFRQEELAIEIKELKQKFRLDKSQKRTPAQIEIDVKNQKAMLAQEKEKTEEERYYKSIRGYEEEIQKIELMLERIRHAKDRMAHKQQQDRRETTLKEFAHISLLDEAKSKLLDKRRFLIDQQKMEKEKRASTKVVALPSADLYDIKRSPASSWAEKITTEPEKFFDLQKFLDTDEKIKNEMLDKSEKFSRDSDYQERQKLKTKQNINNYFKTHMQSLDKKAQN